MFNRKIVSICSQIMYFILSIYDLVHAKVLFSSAHVPAREKL
jgi:hypothetical protein